MDSPPVFVAVTTGTEHSCAVTEVGQAWCWGEGTNGQLGQGDRVSSPLPVRITGGHRFTDITAGDGHTCALAEDGAAWCWGWNSYFQRGNPNDPTDAAPVEVAGGHQFTLISAGWHHTCGLDESGAAWCWGYSRFGQVGEGTTNTAIVPEAVKGEHIFEDLSAGAFHTCALDGDGAAWCWGRNGEGQLGRAEDVLVATEPLAVSGTVRFRQISAGANHTCGLRADGGAFCWGGNERGQLGIGSSFPEGLPGSTSPVSVGFAPAFSGIFAGHERTCGIESSAGVGRCWGAGDSGKLGNGNTADQFFPQGVHRQPTNQHGSDLLRFRSIATRGESHTCGLTDQGAVYCWGEGERGELGVRETRATTLPVRVGF